MEIREPRSKAGQAFADWPTGYSPAKSLQVLAEDISNISAANFERNTKLLQDLQGARTVEDLVSIQTKFMASMFEAFNEHIRLMGARMAEMRNNIVDVGADAASAAPPSDVAAKAVSGLNQAIEATNAAAMANFQAGQEITRSAFEAAEKAAESIRNAALHALPKGGA
jgi:Phasin protein